MESFIKITVILVSAIIAITLAGSDHQHQGYFQYANVPAYGQYEFGYNRGNPHHYTSRYEQGHNWRFRTKVRWGDKYGGYGEHYWDYNHVDKGGHKGKGYGHQSHNSYGDSHQSYGHGQNHAGWNTHSHHNSHHHGGWKSHSPHNTHQHSSYSEPSPALVKVQPQHRHPSPHQQHVVPIVPVYPKRVINAIP